MEQDRSNEELCILAQQGDEGACLQLLKQNRAYIVLQMTKLGFRYHPYWQEMIEWGEIGILSSIQDYDPSYGTTFLTFATYRIETELRNFLHSIRMAYMENYYPDDEDEEGDWAGEELCFLASQELRPLEKMVLSERRDLLLDITQCKYQLAGSAIIHKGIACCQLILGIHRRFMRYRHVKCRLHGLFRYRCRLSGFRNGLCLRKLREHRPYR